MNYQEKISDWNSCKNGKFYLCQKRNIFRLLLQYPLLKQNKSVNSYNILSFCIFVRQLVVLLTLIPQSQITNCCRTASFSGDFDTIVQGLHRYHPVPAQFEWRQFKFKTPSRARSKFRKKL